MIRPRITESVTAKLIDVGVDAVLHTITGFIAFLWKLDPVGKLLAFMTLTVVVVYATQYLVPVASLRHQIVGLFGLGLFAFMGLSLVCGGHRRRN